MRIILSKEEFKECYTPEKLTKTQLSETHWHYSYLDKSKNMIYIKRGDEYDVYSVEKFGQSIYLQKSTITQDEINLFNELIAGTLVEGNDINFSNIRESLLPRRVSSLVDILSALSPTKLPIDQYLGIDENAFNILSNMLIDTTLKQLSNDLAISQCADRNSNEPPNVEFDLVRQQKAQSTPLQQGLLSGFSGFWQPKIVNKEENDHVISSQLDTMKLWASTPSNKFIRMI